MKKLLVLTMLLGVWIAGAILSSHAEAQVGQTWSGRVLDSSTGLPISGAVVQAGTVGRVDPFPGWRAITGANGEFSITWDAKMWELTSAGLINHYLRVSALDDAWRRQASTGYWGTTVIRSKPSEVTVYLTPRPVWIKGRALSAVDRTPLRDTWVNLGIRRRPTEDFGIKYGTRTDKDGFFTFSAARAFPSDATGWPTTLYDIPKDLAPKTGGENFDNLLRETGPYFSFAIAIGGNWYLIKQADVAASIDDSIHTFVTLLVPAAGQQMPANAITSKLVRENAVPPTAPTQPAPPVGEGRAEVLGMGVRLTWPTAQGLGYRLFRSTASGQLGESVTDFGISETTFLDVNVLPNTTYYYVVKPILAEAKPLEGIAERLGPPISRFTVTTGAITGGGENRRFIILTLDSPQMNVNGTMQEVDPGRRTSPITIAGRTMVPIRAIVEALGGSIRWDNATQKITLIARNNTVEMWLDKNDILVNGSSRRIDVAPVARDGRTFVPLRFAAENLGCTVHWISSTREAVIIFD